MKVKQKDNEISQEKISEDKPTKLTGNCVILEMIKWMAEGTTDKLS